MKSTRACPKSAEVNTECPCASGCDKNWKLTLSVGAWSEYVKCSERYVALKPKNLSFSDAAALPLAGVTALQVLRQYKGSLEGKTVFIPAGRRLYHGFIYAPSTDVIIPVQ